MRLQIDPLPNVVLRFPDPVEDSRYRRSTGSAVQDGLSRPQRKGAALQGATRLRPAWEAFSSAFAVLRQASSAAVTTLLRIMCDPKAPPATRVRAAVTVLDLATLATKVENLAVGWNGWNSWHRRPESRWSA